jgi:hypothetical protein
MAEMNSANETFCMAINKEFRQLVLEAQQDRGFGVIHIIAKVHDGNLTGTGTIRREVEVRFKR